MARLNRKRHTPAVALITAGVIGILFAATGLTSVVITIAVFGSVGLYFISLISFFMLRAKEPKLVRPFKVPAGIVVGGISMLMCLFCIYSLFKTNAGVAFAEDSFAYMLLGDVRLNPLIATAIIYVLAFI